jgi:hypothetical protein
MKSILILFLLASSFFTFSQVTNEPFYLKGESSSITADEYGKLYYTIVINSQEEDFKTDAYKFEIPNKKYFENYHKLSEVRKEVDLDTITFKDEKQLSSYNPCDLHNYISSKSIVYLLYENIDGYYFVKMNYLGTQKNVEVLKTGF